MGEVINAQRAFKQKARQCPERTYRVNMVGNMNDYMFLKLAHPSKPRTEKVVAVSLLQYPDFNAEQGDIVKVRLTDINISLAGHMPHSLVSYVEVMGGEIVKDVPFKRAMT